jgi:hypothetical protein
MAFDKVLSRSKIAAGVAQKEIAHRFQRAIPDFSLTMSSLAAIHPVFDQIIDNFGICEGGDIAQRAEIILGDLAQNAPHDLAGPCFRQARRPLD